jgi:hypothetical protein
VAKQNNNAVVIKNDISKIEINTLIKNIEVEIKNEKNKNNSTTSSDKEIFLEALLGSCHTVMESSKINNPKDFILPLTAEEFDILENIIKKTGIEIEIETCWKKLCEPTPSDQAYKNFYSALKSSENNELKEFAEQIKFNETESLSFINTIKEKEEKLAAIDSLLKDYSTDNKENFIEDLKSLAASSKDETLVGKFARLQKINEKVTEIRTNMASDVNKTKTYSFAFSQLINKICNIIGFGPIFKKTDETNKKVKEFHDFKTKFEKLGHNTQKTTNNEGDDVGNPLLMNSLMEEKPKLP